jgi:formylglycine-generating enzyme required for sulfatase activity/DNA-binding CsgD family transcriptional regulator
MANVDNILLLSKYQMRVLYYKCKEGATHEQIAQILGRDVNTIQYHMTKIYKILQISAVGKTKEEMDSELKNEICPTIRQMFTTIDDVNTWAPLIKKASGVETGEREEPEFENKEELKPPYKPPPSVERILRQTDIHPAAPEIIERPPPPRARNNIRRILTWVVIVILVWTGVRFLPQIVGWIGPADTPERPMATEPVALLETAILPTDVPTVVPSISPTIAASPTAAPVPIKIVTETSPKDGMVLVYVPAGEFKMGSSRTEDSQTLDEELPQHNVNLDAYWIDQAEVTNAQYAMCVADDGACTKPSLNNSLSRDNYYDSSLYANYPVIFVSWSQATAYCAWAGRRLPTEAEWEKAARGPEGHIFPWGNTFDGSRANYCDINCINGWKDSSFDDGYVDTSPAGEFPEGASVYGALDMAGNVYEWVADLYGPYNRGDQVNPSGPAEGTERIIRGGSWGDDSTHIRSAVRSHVSPDYWMNFIGFRCAISQD